MEAQTHLCFFAYIMVVLQETRKLEMKVCCFFFACNVLDIKNNL